MLGHTEEYYAVYNTKLKEIEGTWDSSVGLFFTPEEAQNEIDLWSRASEVKIVRVKVEVIKDVSIIS